MIFCIFTGTFIITSFLLLYYYYHTIIIIIKRLGRNFYVKDLRKQIGYLQNRDLSICRNYPSGGDFAFFTFLAVLFSEHEVN